MSRKRQKHNKTARGRPVTIDGETHTLSEWACIGKLSLPTLMMRLRRGASLRVAVFAAVQHRQRKRNGEKK